MKTSSTLDELDQIQESEYETEPDPETSSEISIEPEIVPDSGVKFLDINWLSVFLYFSVTSVLLTGITFSPFNKLTSLAIAITIALVIDISIGFLV